MGYTYAQIDAPATHGAIMYAFKEALVAAGAVVASSGDATSYSSSGDLITSAAIAQTPNAWWRIQLQNGVEMTFQCGSNPYDWRIKADVGAGFVTGSPSATQTPTGADEVEVFGGGTDAAPTFSQLFSGTAANVTVNYGVYDNQHNSFWLVAWTAGNPPQSVISYEELQPGSYPDADVEPYIFNADFQSGGSVWDITILQVSAGWMRFGASGWNPVGGAYPRVTGANFTGGANENHANGAHDLVRMGYFRSASAADPDGWRGWSRLFFWLGTSVSTVPTTSTLLVNGGPEKMIVLNDLAVRWDPSVVPANRAGGALDLAAGNQLDGYSPPYIQGLSPASGADLAADRATARMTPITGNFASNNTASKVFIWAEIGTDSAWPLVIYDGTQFTPLFSDHSTIVDAGDGSYDFSILPSGGWWRDQISIHFGDWFETES